MTNTRCPKCDAGMEEGYLLDRFHGNRSALATWVAGPLERWWWGSPKLRGHRRLTVATRRCSRCGFLESYALDETP